MQTKIAVFTGARSEYGLLLPLIRLIDGHRNFKLQLYVGGGHTSPEYGSTIEQIQADGLAIEGVLATHYTGKSALLDFAETAQLFAESIEKNGHPDCVIVLGDRHEAFAVASAAFLARIPICHLHGGDVVRGGMLDDGIRHAITKLAHLHFPATKASAERILAMGEEPWRVNIVGSPAIDNLKDIATCSREDLAKDFTLNPEKPWILFTQHPLNLAPERAAQEMEESLSALVNLGEGIEIVATAPNQDDGSLDMLDVLKRYQKRHPQIHLEPSLGRDNYLNFVRHVTAVVGNSSSGLLETAYFGTPCVNIGDRQLGRERGENVVDVRQEEGAIFMMVSRVLHDARFCQALRSTQHPFGEGRSAQKILDVLARTDFNDMTLLHKQLSY